MIDSKKLLGWSCQTLLSISLTAALVTSSPRVDAQRVVATVPVENFPMGLAVNTVTNKIYVTNANSNGVTVIDGATNRTTRIPMNSGNEQVVVNPVTNTIYVNFGLPTLLAIDGTTNATTPVNVGCGPEGLAVNTVTNTIYLACGGFVIALDGTTGATTSFAVGGSSKFIAVNSVTNRIYTTSVNTSTVSVVDGDTHAIANIPATQPIALALNPITNKIYVTNHSHPVPSTTVTVIDGATNATSAIGVGQAPPALAVNPATNKIYLANCERKGTVIAGGNKKTFTLSLSDQPLQFGGGYAEQ